MEIAEASNGAKLTKFEPYRFLKVKKGQKDVFVRRKETLQYFRRFEFRVLSSYIDIPQLDASFELCPLPISCNYLILNVLTNPTIHRGGQPQSQIRL